MVSRGPARLIEGGKLYPKDPRGARVTVGAPPPPPARDRSLDRSRRRRDLLLIALTFATGTVDVVSYLGLGSIFTANMTGNTVFLAIAVGQANVLIAARSAAALLGFAAGAYAAGKDLGPPDDPAPWPRIINRVLWVELLLLVVFAAGWAAAGGAPTGYAEYGLIGLSSLAMGMQSAVGRKLAVPGVSSNVLTMALTGLMAELAAIGISGPNERRWAAAIGAMAAGAGIGGAAFLYARVLLPIVPVFVLLLVIVGSRQEN